MTIIQCILIALCVWFAKSGLTPNLTYYGLRPLPASLLVGLIMGDWQTAIAAGIVIQLVYIGTIEVGSVLPSDPIVAGFVGTAFAVSLEPSIGLGAAVAGGLSIAVAIGVPATALGNIQKSLNIAFNEKSRIYAEKGNVRMQRLWHWLPAEITVFSLYFTITLIFLLAIGNEASLGVITKVLTPISKYLSVVGGVLPAVGVALCLRSIATKRTLVFVFAGFFLVAYLDVSIVGVTLVGVILAYLFTFELGDVKKGKNDDITDDIV